MKNLSIPLGVVWIGLSLVIGIVIVTMPAKNQTAKVERRGNVIARTVTEPKVSAPDDLKTGVEITGTVEKRNVHPSVQIKK